MSASAPGTPGDPVDRRSFLPAFHMRLWRLLARLEQQLCAGTTRGPFYPSDAVGRRLLQEVSFRIEPALRRTDADRALRGIGSQLDERKAVRCAGLIVHVESGRTRIGLPLLLGSVAGFLALWGLLLCLRMAALTGRFEAGPATLVMGVPKEGLFRGDDARFAAYARQGPIEPLGRARLLMVQSLTPGAVSSDPQRIRYSRHPLFDRVRSGAPGLAPLISFLGRHLRVAAAFLGAVLRRPLLAVLWRDYAFHAAIEELDARGLLEAVVLTNSNWGRQPLWMTDLPARHFHSHMIFYSQHDRPPMYVDIAERCPVHPTTRMLRADHFWVWTRGHAEMLVGEGVTGRIHTVGPILWEPASSAVRVVPRWVAVFDIMPVTEEASRRIGYLGNYYSTANLCAFLDGIDEAARIAGLRLPLVVKPKRKPIGWHDRGYLEKLNDSGTFHLLPSESSVSEIVSASAAIVVYPYSTVAYVAEWLGVRAIYFDPTGRLEPSFERGEHISFARSVAELAAALKPIAAAT